MGRDCPQHRQHQYKLAEPHRAEGARRRHPAAQVVLGVVPQLDQGGGVPEAAVAGARGDGAVAALAAGHRLAVEAGLVEDDRLHAGELVGVEAEAVEGDESLAEPAHLHGQLEVGLAGRQQGRRGEVRHALSCREQEELAPGGLEQRQLVLHAEADVGVDVPRPGDVEEEDASGLLAQRLADGEREAQRKQGDRLRGHQL